jgi:hypothetical protein
MYILPRSGAAVLPSWSIAVAGGGGGGGCGCGGWLPALITAVLLSGGSLRSIRSISGPMYTLIACSRKLLGRQLNDKKLRKKVVFSADVIVAVHGKLSLDELLKRRTNKNP